MTTRAGRPQCKRKLMNEQVRIIRELHRQGHTHAMSTASSAGVGASVAGSSVASDPKSRTKFGSFSASGLSSYGSGTNGLIAEVGDAVASEGPYALIGARTGLWGSQLATAGSTRKPWQKPRGRVDGKRVTPTSGRQFSRWRRGEQMHQNSLCFTLATICGSVILSAVSIATIRMSILSLSIRFFSSAFASPGPNIRIVSASPMHAITSS